MSKTSFFLLGSTEGKLELIGDKIRCDGWWGNNNDHTIAIYLQNFKGRVWIEASLADDPTDIDWFPIHLNGGVPYVEYPLIKTKPTDVTGDTGVDAFNFSANIVWIRSKVDRGNVWPKPDPQNYEQVAQLGVVKKIMLND